MKKIKALFTAGLLAVSASAFAQTNGTVWTDLESAVGAIASATNIIIGPYAVYGLDRANTWSGGLGAMYNIGGAIGSPSVGLGVALDYDGQSKDFSVFSGEVTLKLPTRPFAATKGWLTNMIVTPFVLAGVGTPMTGTACSSSGVITTMGTGAAVSLCQVLGGQFGVQAAYLQRTGTCSDTWSKGIGAGFWWSRWIGPGAKNKSY